MIDTLPDCHLFGLAAVDQARVLGLSLEYRRPAIEGPPFVPEETIVLSPTKHAGLIADILRDGDSARLTLDLTDAAVVIGQRVTGVALRFLRAGSTIEALTVLSAVDRVAQSYREGR